MIFNNMDNMEAVANITNNNLNNNNNFNPMIKNCQSIFQIIQANILQNILKILIKTMVNK
jgi:uncharacterized membrane protein